MPTTPMQRKLDMYEFLLDFIAHEIRNPLNSIIMFGNLLTEGAYGAVPQKQAEVLGPDARERLPHRAHDRRLSQPEARRRRRGDAAPRVARPEDGRRRGDAARPGRQVPAPRGPARAGAPRRLLLGDADLRRPADAADRLRQPVLQRPQVRAAGGEDRLGLRRAQERLGDVRHERGPGGQAGGARQGLHEVLPRAGREDAGAARHRPRVLQRSAHRPAAQGDDPRQLALRARFHRALHAAPTRRGAGRRGQATRRRAVPSPRVRARS